MGLTYKGMPDQFASWADAPATKFGQVLVRLAMASRAVGEHDAKLARMDEWLVKHEWENHPRYDERLTQRESARSHSVQLRNAEHLLMDEALAFFCRHAPELQGQYARASQLIGAFGGTWPTDPHHIGDPMRRVEWHRLGDAADAPDPVLDSPHPPF